MPLYVLCVLCEAVPVAKQGDHCEECAKIVAANLRRADRNDNRILRIIRHLTTKPSRAKQERKAGIR